MYIYWIVIVYMLRGDYVHTYMYKYVGHVVFAIEKSDLDQVLSRKLPISR